MIDASQASTVPHMERVWINGIAGRLAAGFLILALAACSPPRAVESLSVLSDLAGGADEASVRRLARDFSVEGRAYRADLYLGSGPPQAMLVLLPGVTPAGKDDARLVVFAAGLAQAGFAVLVPDIPAFRALTVSAADAKAVRDAVSYASGAFVADADGGVALAAISYAAGPAILALLDAPTRRRVGLVATIGGYYDTRAVVTFFTTGAYRVPGGDWQTGAPNAWGKWVFARANLVRLDDAGDRGLIGVIVERKLKDEAAAIGDLKAGLGPQGRAVLALLENRDPDRVPELIDGLPPAVRQDLEALSLANQDLSDLTVPAVLLHGRDDPVIPPTESAALAAALPPGAARLYVVDDFAHVELGGLGGRDIVTLWRAVYRLLQLRDALPRPALGHRYVPEDASIGDPLIDRRS